MATKKIELKPSGVTFLEEPHEYWMGDLQLFGLTDVIQRQLFPDEYKSIPWHIVKKAGEYGTQVHKSCEKHDKEWINDGTQEVADYIRLCTENNLVHEASEYTVTDGKHWASNIDKVYRINDDTFDLADIKTYGQLTSEKLERARWQLSCLAYLFELQNKKAKVGRLFVIRLRNKTMASGKIEHVAEIVFVNRIPSDICQELLKAEEEGIQYQNPYNVLPEVKEQENRIRELIETKNAAEEELSGIKSNILSVMEKLGVRTWATDTMRLTRRLPTTRASFNLAAFKTDHADLDYEPYMRSSQVAGSLQIAI